MKYLLVILLFLVSPMLIAQEYTLKDIPTNVTASFRGLSVIDNKIAWLSGSQGWVGSTADGGLSWNFNQVKNFENADFRSIYAFDDRRAIIANAGSPAHILITGDAGLHWKPVYFNAHPDAFFDGIDFWNNKEGIIYGDPIDGKMLLLHTVDGGNSWVECNTAPILEKGEGSFAASGTGIRCTRKKTIRIATGGATSRIWVSNDKGIHWSYLNVPIVQGESTTGIFSILQNKKALIVVGGNYQQEMLANKHIYYSLDQGINWLFPMFPTRGFRECIEPIKGKKLISVGPSGSDISTDNGINWNALSDEKGLHVVRKARKGSLVILSGNKGKVFLLK